MEQKIKLPRKRKKRFLKEKSRADYLSLQILNELLDKNDFLDLKVINGKMVTIKKW